MCVKGIDHPRGNVLQLLPANGDSSLWALDHTDADGRANMKVQHVGIKVSIEGNQVE